MKIKKTLTRLDRLEELIGLLRIDDVHTASQLSQQLGVSLRTLMRDLDLLKEKGYPIETDQGRGGGIRLHRHWGIGRLQLSYREVIDLLLALVIMEGIGSSLFLQNLKSIRHKILATFPESQRTQIQSYKKRILLGKSAASFGHTAIQAPISNASTQLYEAFFKLRMLKIRYCDQKGSETERCIEPHYLFLSWPDWYVLSWDHLRDDIRIFRLDRIMEAKLGEEKFKLRNRIAFVKGADDYIATL